MPQISQNSPRSLKYSHALVWHRSTAPICVCQHASHSLIETFSRICVPHRPTVPAMPICACQHASHKLTDTFTNIRGPHRPTVPLQSVCMPANFALTKTFSRICVPHRSTAPVQSLCMPAHLPTRARITNSGSTGSSLKWRMAMRTLSERCCAFKGVRHFVI